jgi:hypothetical protein
MKRADGYRYLFRKVILGQNVHETESYRNYLCYIAARFVAVLSFLQCLGRLSRGNGVTRNSGTGNILCPCGHLVQTRLLTDLWLQTWTSCPSHVTSV